MFKLRPHQEEVLAYPGGRMGVSAVPGSGKTWTLSLLAAEIIARGELDEDQEVLVVTLVNSAVDHFYQRVRTFLEQRSLLPLNFRVRTLHGLAHDIVRERPDLVALGDTFQILDERQADAIRREVAQAWLRSHYAEISAYLDPNLDDDRQDTLFQKQLPELAIGTALSFIRSAKDERLTPQRLRQVLDGLPVPLPLAEMGQAIYSDYQRALEYRGAVDFDDLVRHALHVLEWDPDLLERLRFRWPYLLEDEAQDSSRLQELILEQLAGQHGNWVRVGDPNQAIFETFTTANPEFLRRFIKSPGVLARQLPNSGRSTQSIIDLANALVTWTQSEHPYEFARDALQEPLIQPTPPDDPQPNPPDDPSAVRIVLRKFTPQQEVEAVADSLEQWLPDHPDMTVAVLAPRNERGKEMVKELLERKIPVVDGLLNTTNATRLSAGALNSLLQHLADPDSSSKLAKVYAIWRRGMEEEPSARVLLEETAGWLRRLKRVEDYLWPQLGQDWLAETGLGETAPRVHAELEALRLVVRRWQGAILLPIDQALLTLAQDLFTEAHELALAHKLALLLRQASNLHLEWRLPQLITELNAIASNERRFLGFSQDDTGFDPERYKGKVVVATLHKAKGLEWDRVYLMSVNNYDFPSGNPGEVYFPEKWFLRDDLNLEAEALAQLGAALNAADSWYVEGAATRQAREGTVRERLRLLYVGITRARRELVMTWNTGKRGNCTPAVPLLALHNYLKERQDEAAA
ncbi:MAG: ATP-dependent helicase [Anaerolineales bacterium]|nr:ATP-dependent helicase [Anaerolineales bacterium]